MGRLLRYCQESDENYERAVKCAGGIACASALLGIIVVTIGAILR
jgi:hypothetical protein